MTKQEIYKNLCYYDKRNPDYTHLDEEYKKMTCYCDNCFYGRNKLALELIRVNNKLSNRLERIAIKD